VCASWDGSIRLRGLREHIPNPHLPAIARYLDGNLLVCEKLFAIYRFEDIVGFYSYHIKVLKYTSILRDLQRAEVNILSLNGLLLGTE